MSNLIEANKGFLDAIPGKVDQLLIAALLTSSQLKLKYETEKGQTSVRNISPIRLTDDNKNILAYCHDRDALRSFKVDRIKSLQIVGIKQGYLGIDVLNYLEVSDD